MSPAPARRFVRGAPVPLYIPLLLVGATSTTILSTDLYAPSLPHLAGYFGTDASTVQLTMSLNFFAYALGQLVLGPLSDRFGRRRVFLVALAAFVVITLACATAPTIDSLIVARVLQGITASAEGVLGYAIINDLYDEKGSAKILAAFGMAVALTPAVAPLLGGFIYVWFGWRAIFYILVAIATIVVAIIYRYLPETLAAPVPDALSPRRLIGGYAGLLSNSVFMGFTVASALPLAALLAFVTDGPFLLIDLLGVPTELYGAYYAVIVAAFFVSSLAANRGVDLIGLGRLLQFGFAMSLLAALALCAIVIADAITPWRLVVPVAVWIFGAGFAFAAAPARALAATQSGDGGHASALLGATQVGCGAIGAQLVELMHDGTAYPVMLVMLGSAIASIAAYALAVRAGLARVAG